MIKQIPSEISVNFAASEPWPAPAEATVYDCALLELGREQSRSGKTTMLQPAWNCPIPIRRVFYLYEVPSDASRGGHAHSELHEVLIAACGSFEVLLDDGRNRRSFQLNRPYYGLHVVPGIWVELCNFSSGAMCLVLASTPFQKADNVRDYQSFLESKSPMRLNAPKVFR
jgi:hypothetical protein